MAGETNKVGEVTLQLLSPLPERIGVSCAGGGTCQLVQCSLSETFKTAEILKSGVIASNNCSAPKLQRNISPKPAELIIFAKPYTKWQCVMQETP